MAPFIEARRLWGDFHDTLIVNISRAIQRQLPDADVTVALQPIVTGIYEASRYFGEMKYDQPIQPPLAAEEAALLSDFLASGTTE